MNSQEKNKKFGKIIYSKNKKQRCFSSYKKNPDTSIKAYDRLINKARKTIEDCKKQLNDDSYFNNKEFYNKHKMAQLIKFNKGLSEYRYDNLGPIAISQEINDNINNRNMTSYNFKDKNKNIYNQLLNSHEIKYENLNDVNEINKLRKKNIQNEKIILEKDKEKNNLINKIKELEKIINDERKKMKQMKEVNKNNNILQENKNKEDKNKIDKILKN